MLVKQFSHADAFSGMVCSAYLASTAVLLHVNIPICLVCPIHFHNNIQNSINVTCSCDMCGNPAILLWLYMLQLCG